VVAGARYTCALIQDGAVWCWGASAAGQTGVLSDSAQFAPAPVRGVARVVQLAASTAFECGPGIDGDTLCLELGVDHTCALVGDGSVWCWGDNARGELGTGDWVSRATPRPVPGVVGATEVSAGGFVSCAQTAAGLMCWGDNAYGQLLDGTPALQLAAAPVAGL
jgi:alpha-tubulin suppressor-like RCC1 family protein